MSAILSVEGLTAGYGKLPVLHDLTLDLAAGRMMAIIGPNGAGKTSLTRAIVSQCTVMQGRIAFDGQEITGRPSQQIAAMGIGYVPQTRNVFRGLTVQENLEMSSLLLDRAEQRRAIDRAYTRFPRLTERRRQQASALSGGERQMLAISSALLNAPRLLVLDEPATGLSPSMSDEVTRGIRDINRSGVTVIWIAEENPQKVIANSHEVVVMAGGTIRLRQDAAEMLAADNFREVFLGV